ncbi:MAG: HlyC/CorC family transporter [Anaerolineae bacterium]|nr:HlyC/CorC family transporter [Anaerolineae bacterium]
MGIVFGLLAVFMLVFLNGFFVAAEFGFVGSRPTRIAQLVEEGNAGARAAQKALTHLDNYIAATQLGITLASLGLGWIGEPAVAHLLEPVLEAVLPENVVSTAGHSIAIAIGFSIVTALHIVLGELAPKSIALQFPEATSVIVSRPTTLFMRVFSPVIRFMNGVGNGVVRLLGFEPAHEHAQVHSAEELQMLVHSSHQAGLLLASEERLLRRAFDFSDIHVQQVMQPRVEVDGIALDTPLPDLFKLIATQHHSRYPVYEESIDNVVGILHVKDLFDKIVGQPDMLTNGGTEFDLRSILRTPLFVPTTLNVDRVLENMQRTQTHVAIVMDEFGGMAGMATMEDIIEELVGEVDDEFDVETGPPTTIEGDTPVFDGRVSLSEAVERFGSPAYDPRSATIGGYVAERLGRIPAIGDRAPFGDYTLSVEEMDGMRVARVRFLKRAATTTMPPDADLPGPQS